MALPLLKTHSSAPAPALITPQEHFDSLHTAPHGNAILWEKATGSRWHKLQPGDAHIPALLAAQAGQKDCYLTVNEFMPWRLVRLLRSLRANYVDIDGTEDWRTALDALHDARLPPPSFIVFSGRGLHLYWLHEPTPAQALPVWQRVQDTLIKALQPLGADPSAKDCTRVLRLVGSVNSKSNQVVRGMVLDAQPWKFHDLCDEVLGPRTAPKAKDQAAIHDLAAAKAKRGQRIYTGSIYDRWHLVYKDLLAIAQWYDFGGIPEGHRNDWLFLSAVSLSWFANPASLQFELERQAKAWTPHLTLPEIRDALKAPIQRAVLAAQGVKFEWEGKEVDPRYRFRRETLWQRLKPIIPPELAPQLRAIVSEETKQQHERERTAQRDRVAEGRHKTRHADSAARTQPWKALGISRATYYRHKSEGKL